MAKGKGASIYLALPTWSVAQSNQVFEGAKFETEVSQLMKQSERTELTYHRSVTLSEWIGVTIFMANKSQKERWKGEKSRPPPLEQFCQNKTTKLNLNQINSLARNTHCRKLKGQRNRLNDTAWIKSATFLRCGKLYRTNNLTYFSSCFFVFCHTTWCAVS